MKDKLASLDPNELASNPRATLDSWLRYRSFVEAAYAMHPQPYVVAPTNFKCSTFATRIRDAIRGCLAFGYECAVPPLDLAKWYGEIIVKFDAKVVYIGPPESAKRTLTADAVAAPMSSGYTFSSLLYEEVSAFMLLLSSGRLVGPVKILQPPDLTLLPSYSNVEALRPADGSLVLF